MANLQVWGMKVYLREVVVPDASIGLYDEGGVSVFRWTEVNLPVSPTLTYKSGLILKNGFSPIKESVDLVQGGAVAKVAGVTIKIDNTGQFFQDLIDLSISWHGLRAEIFEFEYDVTTTLTSERILFYGETNLKDWDETLYAIPLTPTNYKRKAFMGTIIDGTVDGNYPNADENLVGRPVPLTFGNFDEVNHYAKFQRVANSQEIFEIDGVTNIIGDAGSGSTTLSVIPLAVDGPILIFPCVSVVGTEPTLTYRTRLGSTSYIVDLAAPGVHLITGTLTAWAGQYIHITEGNGEGAYRQIDTAVIANTNAEIDITVTDYFEEALAGAADASAEDNSWFEILDVESDFQADTFPCKGYLNAQGVVATTGLNIFAYSDKKTVSVAALDTTQLIDETTTFYRQLPEFAYEDSFEGGADNNSISIDIKTAADTIDKFDNFVVLPPDEITLLTGMSTLVDFVDEDGDLDDFYEAQVEGLYVHTEVQRDLVNSYLTDGTMTWTETGNLASLTDRDSTTNHKMHLTDTTIDKQFSMLAGYLITAPTLPTAFSFDTVYLGVHMYSESDYDNNPEANRSVSPLRTSYRRFLGDGTNFIDKSVSEDYYDNIPDGGEITSLPAFYFGDAPTIGNFSGNAGFFNKTAATGLEDIASFTGYLNFELPGVTSSKKLTAIKQMLVALRSNFSSGVHATEEHYNFSQFYQLAFIFKSTSSIKNEVFLSFAGRVYDDTWDARKTATDLMENPIDILEHVCRLQNWGELGGSPVDYGKEYSSDALINTTSDSGGFDNSDLAVAQGFTLGFQVLKENEMWTDAMKKKLCQLGWVVSYIDENGKENVENILKTNKVINDIITLANVPRDMSIGNLREPDVKNVYCEPFVKYRYDAGAKKTQEAIQILNIEQSSWQTVYTPGLTDVDGLRLWDKCKLLWGKFAHLETPPTGLTNQKWISEYADAAQFLENWIDNMSRQRITIPVGYNTTAGGAGSLVKTWHVGHHLYINLPHQTNGVNIECLVEGISKNKNKGFIQLDLILLVSVGDSDTLIQDTYNTTAESGAVTGDTKDTYDTTSESGSTDEDVKDIT